MILLDTTILLRYLSRESVPALEILKEDSMEGVVAASALSLGEIVKMYNSDELVLTVDLQRWLEAAQQTEMIRWIPIYTHIAVAAEQLENCPDVLDVYDRLIVATSRCFNIPLITGNTSILDYSGVVSVGYNDIEGLMPFKNKLSPSF